jgi:type IV fimbrial biogenesis protein FimT
MRRFAHGLTLIEVLVTLSILAVLLALVAPSFSRYLLVQRIKSVNAELVTDMNMARSTAVSRNLVSRVVFGQNSAVTCYTVFTNPNGTPSNQRCDCTLGQGAACGSSNTDAAFRSTEIKTVSVLRSTGVTLSGANNAASGSYTTPWVAFNNTTGGLLGVPTDMTLPNVNSFNIETIGDTNLLLRTTLSAAGRPSVCSVGSQLGGTPC